MDRRRGRPPSDPRHEPTAPSPEGLRSARRLLRRKEREARREWLVEGPQAVREALRLDGRVRQVFATADAAQRHPDLTRDAVEVTAEQLATICDTVTPQGVVAVVEAVDVDLDEALADDARLVVVCAEVRDPGNAGTVIRCADAFGADAVVMTGASVELGNPKTLRASVGSVFHLPIATGVDLAAAVGECRERGLQVLAADGSGGQRLDDLAAAGELAHPTAWVMGNEAWGLPAEAIALTDRSVGVPIWGAAESLNLATAAAVCLYASAAAQRAAD